MHRRIGTRPRPANGNKAAQKRRTEKKGDASPLCTQALALRIITRRHRSAALSSS